MKKKKDFRFLHLVLLLLDPVILLVRFHFVVSSYLSMILGFMFLFWGVLGLLNCEEEKLLDL